MKYSKGSTEEEKNKGFLPPHLLIKNVLNRLHAPHFGKLSALPKTYNTTTLR